VTGEPLEQGVRDRLGGMDEEVIELLRLAGEQVGQQTAGAAPCG
jgi:hypothetical protein